MESVELHDIGTRISDAFELLGTFQDPIQLVGQRILGTEAQRFKLWAHSLGLHQLGHASLDYWVRDATVVKDRLADFLADMLESLTCLLEIARHERLPYEQDITVDEASSEDLSSTDSLSEASHESGSSAPSSEQSFHEVPFRLQCITESLDALYSLATRIRNPKNRPQRSNDQLYKDVPIGVRAAYIKEREQVETAIVACIQREVLLQGYIPDKEGFFDRKALLDQYASETYWLVRRTGIANARRKQQLIYWKGHAIRLSQLPDNRPPMRATRGELEDQPVLESRPIDLQQINPPTVSGNEEQSDPALGPSLATSATKLPPDFVVLDDLRSVISYHSCVSTVMDLQGRKLEWPPPPAQGMSSKHFMCPYCETLCPQRYLSRELWQVHLMHDLQPYHCTYEDCNDHQRLYGTRQEWIDHECQHSRVWHCEEHSKEFETQKEYVEHLKEAHPQNTAESFAPELIAAAVGHSLYPRRDCPFCPTPFETVKEMQKHIAYHLEKLALRVFPRGGEDSIEESNSGFSNTMTSPILEIPAFSPEEGILESFTSHMLKQWTGEAVGGRTYVRTRRMINWMRTSESKEGMANGGLLLEAVYEAARKPSSEFLPIEWEQISSDNCIIMFGLLTVLGYGHLIDVFARNGIQRYLRKAGFILEKHILTDHFQSPDSAEDFMLAFERRRWEFSPVEFNLGMDIVLGDHRCVLPFCHKQRINHKGATAELFEVAVEEDFVHETLRVAIQGSRYNDSVYGLVSTINKSCFCLLSSPIK
ncbi:hypothetical protein F4803DRAFT_545018 [Xylaria telfairii]|nr:hypothetical protein F4803DRAFT_545018 [Xylaria telfairii]